MDKYQINFQILCRITDTGAFLDQTSRTFENKAAVRINNHEFTDTGYVTINRYGCLTKDMEKYRLDSNELPFTITINPFSEDLCKESDTLPPLIDEFSDTIALYEESLKVKYDDGTDVAGYTFSVENDNGKHKMIISSLPDNRKLIITYNARLTSAPDTDMDITNKAYWSGYSIPDEPLQIFMVFFYYSDEQKKFRLLRDY